MYTLIAEHKFSGNKILLFYDFLADGAAWSAFKTLGLSVRHRNKNTMFITQLRFKIRSLQHMQRRKPIAAKKLIWFCLKFSEDFHRFLEIMRRIEQWTIAIESLVNSKKCLSKKWHRRKTSSLISYSLNFSTRTGYYVQWSSYFPFKRPGEQW